MTISHKAGVQVQFELKCLVLQGQMSVFHSVSPLTEIAQQARNWLNFYFIVAMLYVFLVCVCVCVCVVVQPSNYV